MSEPDPITQAITGLITSPHWPVFEAAIRDRREQWIADTRGQQIYQNHAELTHTMARVAECDWLLELFDDSRKHMNGEAATSS